MVTDWSRAKGPTGGDSRGIAQLRWIRWKPLKNPHSPARAVSTKCCKVGARPRNRESFFGSGGGGPTRRRPYDKPVIRFVEVAYRGKARSGE